MKTQKQKTAATMVIIAIAILIIAIAVMYAVSKKEDPKKTPDQFANCKVLFNSCKDKNCDLLFLCNETDFSDCKVYDCGDNYGVKITGKDGKIQEKTREKTSPCENEEIQEMIAKCSGTFEIMEKKNCENGEAKAKIKLNTKGNCKINSATMAINGKMRIANIEQNKGFHNISVKSCGEISNIKITGEGGVAISEKIEVPEPKEGMMPGDMMEERLLPKGLEEREM